MPPFAAAALVFLSSAAVLVLEILAARLLAPYVGATLETYTAIIGVILGGIALGSWLGGKAADARDPRGLLAPLLITGGALAFAAIPLIDGLGVALRGAGPLTTTTLTVVAFFAPAAVLSAVTPAVIKIQLASLDETGRVVGRLSALGTAGAIVGTFATGFVLIAAFPTRPIVLAIGALLVGGGSVVWWALGARRVPVPALVGALAAATLGAVAPVPCQLESAYYCAQLVDDPDRASGRTLILDALQHSYVDLDDPTHLEFPYTVVLDELVIAETAEDADVLHLGGGGFTLPRHLAATRPDSTHVVVEVDPALVGLARDELAFDPDPHRVTVVIEDARLEVAERAGAGHAAVIGDAFGGLAVPWHLTTAEFLADVRAAMGAEGVYALNMIDHPPLGFARAHAATLAAVFAHAAVLAPAERLDGQQGGNFVLVAADRPVHVEAALERARQRDVDWEALTGQALDQWVADAPVLTDDYAPVDQLLTVQPIRERVTPFD